MTIKSKLQEQKKTEYEIEKFLFESLNKSTMMCKLTSRLAPTRKTT